MVAEPAEWDSWECECGCQKQEAKAAEVALLGRETVFKCSKLVAQWEQGEQLCESLEWGQCII